MVNFKLARKVGIDTKSRPCYKFLLGFVFGLFLIQLSRIKSITDSVTKALHKHDTVSVGVTTLTAKPGEGKDQTARDGDGEGNGDGDGIEHRSHKELTYALTVVHCDELRMEWLNDVPKEWDLRVYETCGENVSSFSRPFKNAGFEECSAYLTTMIDAYDHLPDISVFAQGDLLLGGGREKKLREEHSPFRNFTELVHTIEDWGEKGTSSFLAFGKEANFGIRNINQSLNYIGYNAKEIFDIMGLPYTRNGNTDTNLHSRPGACFAVHKDRILGNDPAKYVQLRDKIMAKKDQEASRKVCCGLERTWHAILGEPYALPKSSTVDDLWKSIVSNN